MVVALGYLWLAVCVWIFVLVPAVRELRVRARRRAIARDLDAFAHVLPASGHGQGVQPRRARVVALSILPPGQSRLADHDDAA